MSKERLVSAAGSTVGRLALLAAVVVVVWLTSVVAATVTDSFADFGEAAWSGLRHLLDPGALADDVGAGQRLVGVVQVVAGIVFLVGVVFTVLADLVDRGLKRLSEASPPVRAEEHLVVIGDGAAPLIHALAAEPAGATVDDVVLLLPPEAEDPTADWPSLGNALRVRFGDPRYPGVLAGVSAASARAIVVLSPAAPDPKVADLAALEIAAAIGSELEDGGLEPPLVAIEIHRWSHVEDLWSDFLPHFDAVLQDRGVGATLALAVANPVFAEELTSVVEDTAMPIVTSPGTLADRPFGEALARLPGRLPLGVIRSGRARYAPAADEVIRGDDALIVLAAPGTETAGSRPRPQSPSAAPARLALERVPVSRLLVLGWSEVGDSLLDELGEAIEATVVVGGAPSPRVPSEAVAVEDLADRDALVEAVGSHDPDAVVVLAGENGAAEERSVHAHAAFVALHLSAAAGQRQLPIIVEQESIARAQRLREADPRIQVVSAAELSAQALLLSVLDRPRQVAIEALAADPALRIETLRLDGDEPVPLPNAWRALLDRGMVPLGLRREGESLELYDPAAESLLPADQLLVVARDAGGPA